MTVAVNDLDDVNPVHPTPELDAQVTSQPQVTASPSVPDAQQVQEAHMAQHAPMTESQVRLEMGKMNRDQLENAFIKLSQSHQPSDESVASLLGGQDILPKYTPITKRVETFVDQVDRFETHMKVFKSDMDHEVRRIHGGITKLCLDWVLEVVVGDVQVSLRREVLTFEQGLELWSNGMCALFKILESIIKCDYEELTEYWGDQMVIHLVRGLRELSAAFLKLEPMTTSDQSSKITETWQFIAKYHDRLQSYLHLLDDMEERIDAIYSVKRELDGVYEMMYERMKGTHAALVDIKTPTNSMTLTLESLSILSRNANYREQQQLPSDTSSKAIARWAGLDWGMGEIVVMKSIVMTRDFLTIVITSRLGTRLLVLNG
jgi:hypothetical protein